MVTTEEEWKPTIHIVVDGCDGEKEVTIKTDSMVTSRSIPVCKRLILEPLGPVFEYTRPFSQSY